MVPSPESTFVKVLTPNLKILRFTRFIIHSQAGGSWVGNIYSRTFTAFLPFVIAQKPFLLFFTLPVYSVEFLSKTRILVLSSLSPSKQQILSPKGSRIGDRGCS